MARPIVIVVEDEPMLRADAALLLDEAGLEVIAVASADEALAFLATNAEHVAAIFTDLQMPGFADGLQLAEAVARQWKEIVVLVTSGKVEPSGPLPGNARFIPKPWRPLDVLVAMQGPAA